MDENYVLWGPDSLEQWQCIVDRSLVVDRDQIRNPCQRRLGRCCWRWPSSRFLLCVLVVAWRAAAVVSIICIGRKQLVTEQERQQRHRKKQWAQWKERRSLVVTRSIRHCRHFLPHELISRFRLWVGYAFVRNVLREPSDFDSRSACSGYCPRCPFPPFSKRIWLAVPAHRYKST